MPHTLGFTADVARQARSQMPDCSPMGATIASATNSVKATEVFVRSVATAKSPMKSKLAVTSVPQAMQARAAVVPSVRQVGRPTSCKWSASHVMRNTTQPILASTGHARSAQMALSRMWSKLAARHARLATLVPAGRAIGVIWALNRTETAPSAFSAQTIVSVSTGTSVNFALLVSLHVTITERA